MCLDFVWMVMFCLPALAQGPDRAEWMQWRGTDRAGAASLGAEWPKSLDEKTLVEQYRVPPQPSYSGPIVTQDRAFVTDAILPRHEYSDAHNHG